MNRAGRSRTSRAVGRRLGTAFDIGFGQAVDDAGVFGGE